MKECASWLREQAKEAAAAKAAAAADDDDDHDHDHDHEDDAAGDAAAAEVAEV
jgi:hypothetical protein